MVDGAKNSTERGEFSAGAIDAIDMPGGTHIIFPPYRAAPPPGTTDLGAYPRAVVLLNEMGLFAVPALYAPAGGVTGRTTLATAVWLIAWGGLHVRWKARAIAPGRVFTLTLILIGAGVLGTFPPLWGLFSS